MLKRFPEFCGICRTLRFIKKKKKKKKRWKVKKEQDGGRRGEEA
jgi:hypothetical protein